MKSYQYKQLDVHNVHDTIRGWVAAFPHWKYADALDLAKEQVQRDDMFFWGAYDEDTYMGLIVGAKTYYGFRGMQLEGFELDHLHIEPLHRKKGVSRFLIQGFQNSARDMGYSILNVGPFSTEFYRNMGYGFGSKVMSLTAEPHRFQSWEGAMDCLEYYDGKNRTSELTEYIHTQRNKHHGSWNFKKCSLESTMEDLANGNYITIMAMKDDAIQAVLTYKAARKISIDNFFFSTPSALQALSTYLHNLKGNIEEVEIEYAQSAVLAICNEPEKITLREESMIKIIDVERFFQQVGYLYPIGEDYTMQFTLHDSLDGATQDVYLQRAAKGLHVATPSDVCDARIEMEMSDFSSLAISLYPFKTFYMAGRAKVDDPSVVDKITTIFHYPDIPYNI